MKKEIKRGIERYLVSINRWRKNYLCSEEASYYIRENNERIYIWILWGNKDRIIKVLISGKSTEPLFYDVNSRVGSVIAYKLRRDRGNKKIPTYDEELLKEYGKTYGRDTKRLLSYSKQRLTS